VLHCGTIYILFSKLCNACGSVVDSIDVSLMTNTDSINTVSHKRGCLLKALEEKKACNWHRFAVAGCVIIRFYTLNAYKVYTYHVHLNLGTVSKPNTTT